MDQATPALAQSCPAVTIGPLARSAPSTLGPGVSPTLRYEAPNHGRASVVSQWHPYWKFDVDNRLLSESWA
jgi:hypothetical protein